MALKNVSITLSSGTIIANTPHAEAIALLIDEMSDLYQGISADNPALVDNVTMETPQATLAALGSNPVPSNTFNANTRQQSISLNLPLDMVSSSGAIALKSRLKFGTP